MIKILSLEVLCLRRWHPLATRSDVTDTVNIGAVKECIRECKATAVMLHSQQPFER